MADIQIKDYLRETQSIQSRLVIAAIALVLLCAILLIRLYYLQVIQHDHYATLSLENRIRLIPVPPVRGQIYDRNGVMLAQNFPVYTLEVVPDQVDDMEPLLAQLAQLVELSESDLERFHSMLQRRPSFEGQTLRANLSDEEAARFAVNRYRFKGVELKARLQRYYPHGDLTAHVIGYVGRISERDLDRIDHVAYRGTEYIGKLGIEARYEQMLLGEAGFEQVETNAHGRVVRLLNRTAPVAGPNLHLSIDIRLQKVARDALAEQEGAVVAIEPSTGAVLAFTSTPSYDPNPFVDGIDRKSYQALRNSESRPLLNRALNGRYAPGSTIKGFMGLAGLEYGQSPTETNYCPGWYSLKNSRHRYRCWKRQGHGLVDLSDAIIQSCDVYFYKLANMLGIGRMHSYLKQFGFGETAGIDLLGEPSGLMPSVEWKKEARGEPWYPGETVIAGIGQGYVLATPLQLAVATATLANRGVRPVPQLVRAIGDPKTGELKMLEPQMRDQVSVRNAEYFDVVIQAMTDVVHGERGTARRIGVDLPYRMAGKTGTSQVIRLAPGQEYNEEELEKRFRDHALFIALAPVEDPQIAVAVVAEHGGSGSRIAAPIARQVLDYYLVERHIRSPQFTGGPRDGA
ncbi:MAG: penicillin-binding protein 2 [Gammaproteobacteria bacterium]|nr:penicillin-binding protein 2 [Gammaproteobacteria bacterium]